LKLPYRTVSFRNGAKSEEKVILTVEVGDAVNDAAFDAEAGK